MQVIEKYFPELSAQQKEQFSKLPELYSFWNERINVISRKDIEHLCERHILHSLSIAKFFSFMPRTKIADVGTGGGFPGIPLAILFPEVQFILIDSIAKKIKVVTEITQSLELKNVTPVSARVESMKEQFDFVVSRAVTSFPEFVGLVEKQISKRKSYENKDSNGIIYLKGGEFEPEIAPFLNKVKVYSVDTVFEEEFFQTKKIIYLKF